MLHRRGKALEESEGARESSDKEQGELERRVQKLEEALLSQMAEPRKPGTMMVVEEPEEETETQDLSEEVHTLSARVAQLERTLASPATPPKLEAGQGGQQQLNSVVGLLVALLMVVAWPTLSGITGLGINN